MRVMKQGLGTASIRPFKVLCAATVAFCALTTPSLAQLTDVGVNAAVRNEVSLQSAGSEELRAAVPAEKVFLGDEVTSGDDSVLQILLKDETVFTVGENCKLTIDEFVYDPATEEGSISATVASGAFRFMSGKVARNEPENVRVDTPVAYMGIRGTVLDVLVGTEAVQLARQAGLEGADAVSAEEGATLVVLRGPGRDQAGLNREGGVTINSGGDELTLWKSGAAAFVSGRGRKIAGPFILPETINLALANSLQPAVQDDQAGRRPIPDRNVRRVIRRLPDLSPNRLPPPTPGPSDCPGPCPNPPGNSGQSFTPGDSTVNF